MLATTAGSTCAVQMLEVAFSRRMCCSRVCSARRSGRRAVRVGADADQPARHLAGELVARGEVGGVRAAIAHRHAEALRCRTAMSAPICPAARAASAPAGRRRVIDVAAWRPRRSAAQVAHPPSAGVLTSTMKASALQAARWARGDHRHADPEPGARAQHLERLRMAAVVGDDAVERFLLPCARSQRHRLGGGGGSSSSGAPAMAQCR